jgi:urease accessory protein
MITDPGLTRLMTWLSPSFPVGAYAFSHGLEHAVESGDISDADSVISWVDGILTFGAGRVDATFFRAAFESVQDDDHAKLRSVVARAEAQRGTAEMALESAAQGRAFLETVIKVWPDSRLSAWRDDLAASGREPAYAVAVGVACAVADIPLQAGLVAFLNAFAANLVSAVVRLVPLGQTDGQRAMAALEDRIVEAASATLRRDAGDFASAALAVDWHSMQHETQYTRLFRS